MHLQVSPQLDSTTAIAGATWILSVMFLVAPSHAYQPADTPDTLPAPAQWLTGKAFQDQLEKPFRGSWTGTTVRHLTRRIASHQRTCIFLDRRVNPDQPIDFAAQAGSLEQNLQQLARQLNMGYCKIGPCIYLGPAPVTHWLATLAEVKRQEITQFPGKARERLLSRQGWQWQRLATPESLLLDQLELAELRRDASTRLPHDLWSQQTLPPLDFAKRMSILLAGFNLTYEIDMGKNLFRLVPFPGKVVLQRTYTQRLSTPNLARVKTRFPAMTIQQGPDRLQAQGRHEDHLLLDRLLRGETVRNTVTKPSQKRFTLRVTQAPATAILDSIAQQLQLTVRFDPGLADKLKERINLDVKEVTLQQLLEQTLAPLGLSYRLEDHQLTIMAR